MHCRKRGIHPAFHAGVEELAPRLVGPLFDRFFRLFVADVFRLETSRVKRRDNRRARVEHRRGEIRATTFSLAKETKSSREKGLTRCRVK